MPCRHMRLAALRFGQRSLAGSFEFSGPVPPSGGESWAAGRRVKDGMPGSRVLRA